MSAYTDLMQMLEEGERVQGIVFGTWGDGESFRPKDIEQPPIGTCLTLLDAQSYLEQDWSFENDLGEPYCFAIYVWTNNRVLFIHRYDGYTCLTSVPRDPTHIIPEIVGE